MAKWSIPDSLKILAIRTLKTKYETKDDSTCRVQASEPDTSVEAANPVPALVAAAPVVIAAPPLTATSGPGAQHRGCLNSRRRYPCRCRLRS